MNANEQKILKWKLEGKHVIKHHPLITQVKTWSNIPVNKLDMIVTGASDEIHKPDYVDTPEWTMAQADYTWVSQGSNVQTVQPDVSKNEYQVIVTTSWIGALSVVTEFYGQDEDGRWTFGEM